MEAGMIVCPKCGASNAAQSSICGSCGGALQATAAPPAAPAATAAGTMQNTSGQGASAVAPAEIQGWNWGAFWLTWIWGIGNNTMIALLALIACISPVVAIYMGLKGSELAWRNRRFEGGVAEFKKVQGAWAKWGWILFAVSAAIGIAWGIMFEMAAGQMATELNNMPDMTMPTTPINP